MKPCPDGLSAGYYWYGNKRKGPGRPPKWVEKLLSATDKEEDNVPHEDPTPMSLTLKVRKSLKASWLVPLTLIRP
jgi:hypothetical protein